MLTMTNDPATGESGEIGWAKHETDGKIISVTSIPEDDRDQIWAVTERVIDDIDNPGETKTVRHVEYFDYKVFTDGTLTYPEEGFEDDPPIQDVAGLDHLEGKTVTVKVDGATHPDRVVTNGQISLNTEYQNIEIGLKYTPRLKLMRFETEMATMTTVQGQKGRWSEIWLRIVNSAYPLVNGYRTAERNPSTPMDRAEPLITGDVSAVNLGWDNEKQIVVEQDLPLPLHVTAIFGDLTIN